MTTLKHLLTDVIESPWLVDWLTYNLFGRSIWSFCMTGWLKFLSTDGNRMSHRRRCRTLTDNEDPPWLAFGESALFSGQWPDAVAACAPRDVVKLVTICIPSAPHRYCCTSFAQLELCPFMWARAVCAVLDQRGQLYTDHVRSYALN